MTRLDSIRRAWVHTAEHHASVWETALQAGNAELARSSAAAYRGACDALRKLRLYGELGSVGR